MIFKTNVHLVGFYSMLYYLNTKTTVAVFFLQQEQLDPDVSRVGGRFLLSWLGHIERMQLREW
jgi:hypothetical protein